MLILSLDLAAKFSAACLMNGDYKVIDEFDSWDIDENVFIHRVVNTFIASDAYTLVVEDLPHGLKYSTLLKTVLRLQGRLIDRMQRSCDCNKAYCPGDIDSILFVAPATWRHHYKGLERGTGPTAVVPVSAEFGYTPPDLGPRTLKQGAKAIARKVATDYCSAYLIARWAIDTHRENNTLDVVGTSRWNTPAIRKKDVA